MALDQERRLGTIGLHLGADAAKLAEGALTVADGIRYLEYGAVHTRPGRVRCSLDWPYEGFGTAADYVGSIFHFQAAGRVRGIAPFYDYRIWPTSATNVTTQLPQRLNLIGKSQGTFFFNDDYAGSPTGVVTGDGAFADVGTRAKVVVYGDRAYIVDGKTAPKAFKKLPRTDPVTAATNQVQYKRIKYGIGRMGILWPTAGSSTASDLVQKPVVTASAAGSPTLAAGKFKFRIVLENQFGVQSGPSAFVEWNQAVGAGTSAVVVKWSTIESTFPADAVYVRLYVQVTADGTPADTASAYIYVNRARSNTGATGITFAVADQIDLPNRPLMRLGSGAPPILTDLQIVGDIAYGASGVDIIFREEPETDATVTSSSADSSDLPSGDPISTPVGAGLRNRRNRLPLHKLASKSVIKAMAVNESYFFVSDPREPEYMETWYQLGNGTERIVGLAGLGISCVIFTNERIYVYDPDTDSIRTTPSSIGCISRDSIVSTEAGIRFVGSDGVPRLFNGATVSEIADELLPVFDRPDYVGHYPVFDAALRDEVQATYGDRKFWMSYPVTRNPTIWKPGGETTGAPQRNLAIGDESRGPVRWSIDTAYNYDTIRWLGRESRLLAVDDHDWFYFIEEGLVDEHPTGSTQVQFEVATRRFGGAGMPTQFYAVSLDGDVQGNASLFHFSVDGQQQLVYEDVVVQSAAVSALGQREEKRYLLPAWFKGQYLDARFYGTAPATKRIAIYGITIEMARRGEMS